MTRFIAWKTLTCFLRKLTTSKLLVNILFLSRPHYQTSNVTCLRADNSSLNLGCACNVNLPGATTTNIGFRIGSGVINCTDYSYTNSSVDTRVRHSNSTKDCPALTSVTDAAIVDAANGAAGDVTPDEQTDTTTDDISTDSTAAATTSTAAAEPPKSKESEKDKVTEQPAPSAPAPSAPVPSAPAPSAPVPSAPAPSAPAPSAPAPKNKDTDEESNTNPKPASPPQSSRRRKRGAEPTKKKSNAGKGKKAGKDKSSKPKGTTKADKKEDVEDAIVSSWQDGKYAVYISVQSLKPQGEGQVKRDAPADTKKSSGYTVIVDTRDTRGKLLSAADFPYLYYLLYLCVSVTIQYLLYLYFYLIMTILYVLYGFGWLLMMACYWRDLLRIQYFILIVIILGFIEKVFYYSEYEHVDRIGKSSETMVIVAELVSVGRRTLARALVVVISVGFCLAKPRLGSTLHKLLAVCFIYFILASVESCLRATRLPQEDVDKRSELFALIPLALCETGIIYWVFSSLLQTIRTLRLRRNVVKLSLYRHFTNLLIFCVLVSVIYLVWSLARMKMVECRTDIRELWLEQGFWPMLFSIVLLVIMILWRPSINNQRYSHSILLENEDGEDEEDTLMGSEAFDAKKRSQMNGKINARDKRKTREEKVEDDLQWIEDNIPASVADS
ncbi:TMEM87A [Bugula neritina]|uniref:TMEM87A n=1 Tax=Bugula neritina TaxID=10212 RepID=A0A7J7KCV3_BUGNE|nr:TMEM87A [Bugula neritina]